jgi:hypothetical protein
VRVRVGVGIYLSPLSSLSLSLSLSLSSLSLSLSLSLSIYLSIFSFSLSIFLSIFQSIHLSLLSTPTGMSDHVERFRKVLNRLVLTTSPAIRVPMPYLYTPEGHGCPSRRFLPEMLLSSQRLALALPSPSGSLASLAMPPPPTPGPAGSIDCFKAEHHQCLEVSVSVCSALYA